MNKLFILFLLMFFFAGITQAKTNEVLLRGFESLDKIHAGSWKLNSLNTEIIKGKFANAMLTVGDSVIKNGKADITVMNKLPEKLTGLFMWVWASEDASKRPGVFSWSVFDSKKEKLSVKMPVNWTGWKKIEIDLATAPWEQTYPQKDGNGKIDLPIKSLHLNWFASNSGLQEMAFDQLVGIVTNDAGIAEVAAVYPIDNVSIPNKLIRGEPLTTTAVVNNPTNKEISMKVDYVFFPSHNTEAPLTPDPILGFDIASECPSETIQGGKIVAKNTLTDNSRVSGAYCRPQNRDKKVYKVEQQIDLKRVVKPITISIQNSDANWLYIMNVSASADGKNFTPVSGLQGVDLFHKWQPLMLKIKNPEPLRYLRFSYSTEGVKNGPIGPGKVSNGSGASHFSMPSMIKVYDGINDEPSDFPKIKNQLTSGTIKCIAKPGGFSSASLEIAADKIPGNGCYILGIKIKKSNSPSYIIYKQVYFWNPDKPNKEYVETRFGVNASKIGNADNLRAMGFSLVRFENAKWFMLSNKVNELDFHGVPPWRLDIDASIIKYKNTGLNPVPLMLGVPNWASSKPDAKRCFFYPPEKSSDYKEFAFQFAARYGSKKHPESVLQSTDKKSGMNLLKYFEIWNEPDLNHPKWGALIGKFQDYYPILRAGYEGVKKADSNAKILNGGLSGFHFELWDEMRTHKYSDGKHPLDFIDIMNIHYYCGKRSPEEAGSNTNINRSSKKSDEPAFEDRVKRLVRWRNTFKPKAPIWLTEMGWDTIGGRFVSEKQQASYLIRASVIGISAGIDKFFVYRETDSGRTLYASCGFIRQNKSWKPSAFTYTYMLRRLKQTKAIGEIKSRDPFIKTYLFKDNDGKSFLVAWNCDDEGSIKSKKVRYLILNENPIAIHDSFGYKMRALKKVRLGMFPVYIDLPDNSAELFAKQAAELKRNEDLEYQKNAKRRLVMIDFGDDKHVAQMSYGTLHKATAVPFGQKWNSGKNECGFVKGAIKNEYKHWRRSDALRCDAVRTKKDAVFKIKLPKGRFRVQFGFAPFAGSTAKLTITLDNKNILTENISSPKNTWVSDVKKIIEIPNDNTVLTVRTSQAYSLWYFLIFTEVYSGEK